MRRPESGCSVKATESSTEAVKDMDRTESTGKAAARFPGCGNEPAGRNAILRALYEPNDDYRTDANDELRLVALPMIVC